MAASRSTGSRSRQSRPPSSGVIRLAEVRYSSEGGFTKYTAEGEDGYDTLDWISRQPWCDGRAGTYGLSYAAINTSL